MINYLVKATHQTDGANGKPKKITEQYLVNAMSVTEAEATAVKEFANGVHDFEVKEVKATKIIQAV